ncbi:MAG: hypothetical protein U0W40_13310 [Acidimicrobiia bacterium]
MLADLVRDNGGYPGVVVQGIANSPSMRRQGRRGARRSDVIVRLGAGLHVQMLCVGRRTLVLTRHVPKRGDFTLERAIHELTGRQADTFGFRDRGARSPRASPPTSWCSTSTSCTGTSRSSSPTSPARAALPPPRGRPAGGGDGEVRAAR